MHPRTRELIDHVDAQHAAFRDAIDSVPADMRELRPRSGGWSVAEVVEHMVRMDERLTKVFERLLAEAQSRGPTTESDEGRVVEPEQQEMLLDRTRKLTAPDAVAPTGTMDADTAWRQLEERRTALREILLAGDGLALGNVTAPHPRFGPYNWYQWGAFVGGHEARHAAQIREIRADLIGPTFHAKS